MSDFGSLARQKVGKGKTTAEKYIEVREAGASKTGLTKIWAVINRRTEQTCGEIRWWGGFRQYTFFPTDGFLFDTSCLRLIADRLEAVNAERYHKL